MAEELAEAVAAACHEVNRAYCLLVGDPVPPPWQEATRQHREGMTRAIRNICADPMRTPESQHQAWMAARAADGWVFGTVKDEAAKAHPCLVPYQDLPERQRRKDELFLDTARRLIAALSSGT